MKEDPSSRRSGTSSGTHHAGSSELCSARYDFPIFDVHERADRLVYLDNAATTQKPGLVLAAVRAFYCESNANVHRSGHALGFAATQSYESARERVRAFIGAEHSHEIVFTRGATESINLVARCLGDQSFGPRDKILVTEMEHHSNLLPWRELCRRTGAELVVLPIDDEGSLRLGHLEETLERGASILAMAHVSNSLGIVNDIERIVDLAHAAGCIVLVDGAQAVAHLPVNVRELGCDFYAFSGHKMYADNGIGVLYARESLLDGMSPWLFGGGMVETVDEWGATYAGLPSKFEGGTPNAAGAVSLSAAIGYLQEFGLDAIHAHEANLTEATRAALSALPEARLHGGSAPGSIVSFNIEGAHPFDVAAILDKTGVAVGSGAHCAQPLMMRLGVGGMVRVSFAVYNAPADVDALVEGLARAVTILT